MASITVKLTGPVLSFMFYENVNSPGNQEGFLLGEVTKEVISTISDTEIDETKIETVTNIHSALPCPNLCHFYNGLGVINKKLLQTFLKDKVRNIVGWYSFRRNSSLTPSFRETAVHNNLCSTLGHLNKETFVFCLATYSVSVEYSTHTFDHVFHRLVGNIHESLPVQIQNLGKSKQVEYRVVSTSNSTSDALICLFDTLSTNIANPSEQSEASIHTVQALFKSKLNEMVCEVKDQEDEVRNMTSEIIELKQKLESTTQIKNGRQSFLKRKSEVLLPLILTDEPIRTLRSSVSSENLVDKSTSSSDLSKKSQNRKSYPMQTDNMDWEDVTPSTEEANNKVNKDPFAFITDEMKQMVSTVSTPISSSQDSSSDNSGIVEKKAKSTPKKDYIDSNKDTTPDESITRGKTVRTSARNKKPLAKSVERETWTTPPSRNTRLSSKAPDV